MIIVTAISKEGGEYQLGIPVPAVGVMNKDAGSDTYWINVFDSGQWVKRRIKEDFTQIQQKIKESRND